MTEDEPAAEDPRTPSGVHAATLLCEVCGEETPHRIVRLDPAHRRVVSGLARCRTCRTTHPFQMPAERPHRVFEIVSDGAASTRKQRAVPSEERLTVGEHMPRRLPPAVIHKIDRTDGRSVRSAVAQDVHTVWLTPDVGAVVKVSMVDGRRTSSARITLPPETVISIGAPLQVDGRTWHISAMRANGRTWRHLEDSFHASQVERIYARRNTRPPAGSNDWRRSRASPESRANSTSRSARSRSGPGVRT